MGVQFVHFYECWVIVRPEKAWAWGISTEYAMGMMVCLMSSTATRDAQRRLQGHQATHQKQEELS